MADALIYSTRQERITPSGYMKTWKFLVLKSIAPFKTQQLPVYLPSRNFFYTTMSRSPDLQPQKRVLAEESENLLPSDSKKPRLVEETIPHAKSSSVPPSLDASPWEDVNNKIIKDSTVEMRMVVDDDEDLVQTEKVNRPSGSKLGGTQSQGRKKKIRPPRAGRRSRNEEDEEKGTLLSSTGEMEPKALRLPKRLCALLLGFCGSGYRGMQM